MAIKSFKRYEKKYLLNQSQYDELIKRISEYMDADEHCKNGNNYSIYNMKIALEGGLRRILDITLSEREQTEWIISIGLVVCMVLIIFISVFFARYFLKMHKYCNEIAENSALIQSLEMEEVFESIKFPVRRIRIKTSDVLDTPASYGFLHPVIIMPKDLNINDKDTLKCILLH